MLLKHERDRDKLEQAAGAPAHKYSRGLNHLFLDPVREVAQCDFGSRMHLYREPIVMMRRRIASISSFLCCVISGGGEQYATLHRADGGFFKSRSCLQECWHTMKPYILEPAF